MRKPLPQLCVPFLPSSPQLLRSCPRFDQQELNPEGQEGRARPGVWLLQMALCQAGRPSLTVR